MLIVFQNSFTIRLSSKRVYETVIKDPTTPQVHCYTTLWKISVKTDAREHWALRFLHQLRFLASHCRFPVIFSRLPSLLCSVSWSSAGFW